MIFSLISLDEYTGTGYTPARVANIGNSECDRDSFNYYANKDSFGFIIEYAMSR